MALGRIAACAFLMLNASIAFSMDSAAGASGANRVAARIDAFVQSANDLFDAYLANDERDKAIALYEAVAHLDEFNAVDAPALAMAFRLVRHLCEHGDLVTAQKVYWSTHALPGADNVAKARNDMKIYLKQYGIEEAVDTHALFLK